MNDCTDLNTERMTPYECQASCDQQTALLAAWTDGQKRDAFDAELRCLDSSTCDDIAGGVCYDQDVWSF